ncbi:kinase-like domain-containing protein [Dunaliella salina]|uniref:Kinase-like domain-containing protein n=1 Tax=Dunaliella salina TaxID=3046 RepID=A0ABQ7G005_DUNSA|nr:kinase-like domain-containing protein [Dunaliella salina]|eukprot:KAF5827937.1 kinase-like domain-containing protein [Dunaliella salina]
MSRKSTAVEPTVDRTSSLSSSTVESSDRISGLSSRALESGRTSFLSSSTAGCLGFVQERTSPQWAAAGSKIMAANEVSSMFETLRDQRQVNKLDPSRLKLVKVLGEGAFATVNLCELLPELQPQRRPSLPTYLDNKSPAQRMETAPKNGLQLNRPISLPTYPKKGPAQCMEFAPKNGHPTNSRAGGGLLVAVKCLKPGTSRPMVDLDSFIQEAALTRKLKHQYIVDFIGMGFMDSTSEGSKQRTMFIAQEYMAGGTLRSMVYRQMLSPNRTVYTDQQALQWSLQVAEALAYLHSAVPMVIHRDLKLENVLLTSEAQTPGGKVAKLADFGLVALACKESAHMNLPPAGPASMQSTPQRELTRADAESGALRQEDEGLASQVAAMQKDLEQAQAQTKALQDNVTALGQQLAGARTAASGDAAEVVEATRFRNVERFLKDALIDLDQAKEEQRELHECARVVQHMGGTYEHRSGHEQLKSSLEQLTRSLEQLTSFGCTSPKKKGASSVASKRLRSSILDAPKQLSGQTGSFMYMSPEMFKSQVYNEKVDVFSFGVMMYELFHRYLMVCTISNAGSAKEVVGYVRKVSNGYRPPIGERWPPEFRKLLTDCMAQDAKDRPAMSEVAERLKVMLQEGLLDDVHVSSGPSCCVVS